MSSVSKPRVRHNRHKQGLNLTLEKLSADFRGKRMGADDYPLLIYLPYDESKNQSAAPNRLRRWTMGYVREVQKKFDIQIDENTLASRMCIALNKRLFSITKSEKSSVITR